MIATVAALAIVTPLAAKDKPPVFVETSAVKDKPSVALDPTKAYVMLRSAVQTPLMLMKVPTVEDQATYDKLRTSALAEAKRKYTKALANYEEDKVLAAKTPGMRAPARPVEPTEGNFEFPAFGMMASVSIGPMNRFAKTGISTYLQEVTPGAYRVYGFLSAIAGAAPIGSCFCMGSVLFDARAGEITDLGVTDKAEPIETPKGDSSYPALVMAQTLFSPAIATMPADPRLAGYKLMPASFKPAGKLPNYFGVMIGRVPEMPGVFRYERDRIVDLTVAIGAAAADR